MSFVLVLRGVQGARPAQLGARLASLGYDVCIAPNGEAGSLRAGLLRSLISQCSLVAAVWSKGDFADPALLETMADAAAQGKLVAASGDGARFPTQYLVRGSGLAEVPNDIEAMVDAVVQRARPTGSNRVAKEYAAFQRAIASGDAAQYGRFLSAYPSGVFAALAHAERGFAETPRYKTHSRALEGAAWRLNGAPAFGIMAATAAFAMAVGVAVLGPGRAFMENALNPRPESAVNQPAKTEAARGGAAAPALASNTLPEAAPLPEAQAAAQGVQPQARTAARDEASPESGPIVRVGLPPASPALSPGERQLTVLRSQRLARLDAFDANALEPSLRAVVEQARRRQAYARAEAARDEEGRPIGAQESRATYQGDWSGGHASGLGRAQWSDGGLYEGSWRRSRPHGMGVMEMASGVRYEGEFDSGAPTGRGVFWSAQGEPLSGSALFSALVQAQSASAPSEPQSAR